MSDHGLITVSTPREILEVTFQVWGIWECKNFAPRSTCTSCFIPPPGQTGQMTRPKMTFWPCRCQSAELLLCGLETNISWFASTFLFTYLPKNPTFEIRRLPTVCMGPNSGLHQVILYFAVCSVTFFCIEQCNPYCSVMLFCATLCCHPTKLFNTDTLLGKASHADVFWILVQLMQIVSLHWDSVQIKMILDLCQYIIICFFSRGIFNAMGWRW